MTRPGGSVAVLLTASLVLTACGDGDDESDPADARTGQAVSALATGIEEDNQVDADTRVISADEADCVARSIVDELGVDRLVELKVLEEDLGAATIPDVVPKPMRNPQVDALSECVGVVEYLARSTRVLFTAVADTPKARKRAADDTFWAEVTDCLKAEITEKKMKQVMVDSAEQPGIAQQQLGPALERCEATVG